MAVVGVGVAQVGVGESPNSVLEDIPLACQKENLTSAFGQTEEGDCQSDKGGGSNPNTSALSI